MTWFGSRKEVDRPLVSASSRLIADTEAFLSGQYADHLQRHRDAVPAWARLNALAHGDLATLGQDRRTLSATRLAAIANSPEEVWRRAEQLLAAELLEFVDDDPEKLSCVQKSVLVPLELSLILVEVERGLSAAELVQATRSALRSSTA